MGLHGTTLVLVVAKTTTLAFGSILTYLSFRAFKRTGSHALRALAAGIGLLTLGAFLGGALHQVAGISLRASVGVQSVFTAAGFAVMTYSLFTDVIRGRSGARSRARAGD
jgi:hypothetical protein